MDEKVTITELYDAYVECRTKKRWTIPCADFELNEAANLYDLWIDLNTWNVSRVAITRWLGSWCTRIAITYAAAPGTQ